MSRRELFITTLDRVLGSLKGATVLLDTVGYAEFGSHIDNAYVFDAMEMIRKDRNSLIREINNAKKIALWLTRPVPPSRARDLLSIVLSRVSSIPVAIGIRIPQKIPDPDKTLERCNKLAFKLSLLVNGGHEVMIVTALGNRLSVKPVKGSIKSCCTAAKGQPAILPPGKVIFKAERIVGKLIIDHGIMPLTCRDMWLEPIKNNAVSLSLEGKTYSVEGVGEFASRITGLPIVEFGFGCADLDPSERDSSLVELYNNTAHVVMGKPELQSMIPTGSRPERISFVFRVTSFRG